MIAAGLLATPAFAAANPAPTGDELRLRYDVKVAWMRAGQLRANLRPAARYELDGTVATSGTMDRFFSWRGTFAATGRMVNGFPETDAYLLFEEDGKDREVLLATRQRTTIHATDRESKTRPGPPGSDLMSVLFLAPHCLKETGAHDGEDLYQLRLTRTASQALNQKPHYYNGASTRCDYRFRYEDGTVRRISLWMAPWQGRRIPVRIRVRIPVLPDIVLRLRTDGQEVNPSR